MTLDAYLDRWKAVPVRARGLALMGAITLLLAAMTAQEQIRRSTGREIILAAAPIDPRDMLRGAYVQLDYPEVTRVDVAALAAPPDFAALRGKEHLFLLLRRDASLGWRPDRVLAARPRGALDENEVVVRATYRPWSRPPKPEEPAPATLALDIGANRYFADEATAKALDLNLRDKDNELSVVLAVGRDGRATIKGLILNGVRKDESLL